MENLSKYMTQNKTKRISLNSKNTLQVAKDIIYAGGVIIYPTDTLYGFGVDARNESAINRLNKIKNRIGPLSVIAPDIKTVLKWAKISAKDWKLVKKKLIGPTTIILPIKENIVSSLILGQDGSLGIRIPKHSFGPDLSNKLGFPITTTSVNRTNNKPLNDPDDIIREFNGEFDLLIENGILPESKGSTIYKLEKSKLTIIRK